MGEAAPLQTGLVPALGLGMGGAIVERLRARLELCRRHHASCERRYGRGQAEARERERESTRQLLQVLRRGPGPRKTRGRPQYGPAQPRPHLPGPASQVTGLRRKMEAPGPDLKRSEFALRDVKKEPGEAPTCAAALILDLKQEVGGAMDPELQELLEQLTEAVPSLSDLELEKMLKHEDFGPDPCLHLEKAIKSEFSPGFLQAPPPAGPSCSTPLSWPEVSHAEQLKQMARAWPRGPQTHTPATQLRQEMLMFPTDLFSLHHLSVAATPSCSRSCISDPPPSCLLATPTSGEHRTLIGQGHTSNPLECPSHRLTPLFPETPAVRGPAPRPRPKPPPEPAVCPAHHQQPRCSGHVTFDLLQEDVDQDFMEALLKCDDWMTDINLQEILGGADTPEASVPIITSVCRRN